MELELSHQIKPLVSKAFGRVGEQIDKSVKRRLKQIGVPPSKLGIQAEIDHAREQNIRLVEKAMRAYARDVRDVFDDPENHGLTTDELKEKLLKRGNVSESRAELIARDQVLKLNGQINQVRQQQAGIVSYEWSTSRDERVRPEHAELEGETFSWNNPPSVGHPGQDYQCRCVAVPILD